MESILEYLGGIETKLNGGIGKRAGLKILEYLGGIETGISVVFI